MPETAYNYMMERATLAKPVVIIINGSGRTGKDTFCEYFSKFIPADVVSSVTLVKKAFKILVGEDVPKDEAMRKFLSDMKLAWTAYNDGPTKYMINKVKSCTRPVIFLHIREPEEIDKIKTELQLMGYNVTTLLMRNKNVNKIESNMADLNVENYEYDTIINNETYINCYSYHKYSRRI